MQTLLADDIWALKQLQKVGYASAVIGGGAVRDAYFDRSAHDIDIFIWEAHASPEKVHPDFRVLDEKSIAALFDLGILDTYDPHDINEVFSNNFNVFGDYDSVKRLGVDYPDGRKHIKAVWSVYKATFETEYQIIVLNTSPIEYVTRFFDIGLCMCYCDGVKMRFTNEFLTDAGNKTLTICGELTKQEYKHTINNHVQKMKSRFPDFTIVDKLKDTFK